MIRVQTAAALLISLTLTGCFVSDQPLITQEQSVAPIMPGSYLHTDSLGKDRSKIRVAGTTTFMAVGPLNAPLGPELPYLMSSLGNGYYVVMRKADEKIHYEYGLIRIEPGKITEYETAKFCATLRMLRPDPAIKYTELPASGARDDCKFSDYASLSAALRALIAKGTPEPSGSYIREQ